MMRNSGCLLQELRVDHVHKNLWEANKKIGVQSKSYWSRQSLIISIPLFTTHYITILSVVLIGYTYSELE